MSTIEEKIDSILECTFTHVEKNPVSKDDFLSLFDQVFIDMNENTTVQKIAIYLFARWLRERGPDSGRSIEDFTQWIVSVVSPAFHDWMILIDRSGAFTIPQVEGYCEEIQGRNLSIAFRSLIGAVRSNGQVRNDQLKRYRAKVKNELPNSVFRD